jgi:hypothetical protein
MALEFETDGFDNEAKFETDPVRVKALIDSAWNNYLIDCEGSEESPFVEGFGVHLIREVGIVRGRQLERNQRGEA